MSGAYKRDLAVICQNGMIPTVHSLIAWHRILSLACTKIIKLWSEKEQRAASPDGKKYHVNST